MASGTIATQLEQFGPQATSGPPPTLDEARIYCRRLARRHYENFTVASWLLPRRLRQHFCNVYAYCRWADDLADEIADPERSLELLDWWEQELRNCYHGRSRHPVMIALAETVGRFEIPAQPFVDLLAAFRQDQRQSRYETFDDLLGYCRHSANPVGRLVLYLGGCHDESNSRLSDSICTGLQLANCWQDVARDFDRGRIYLPRESCRRFGYDESMFDARQYNGAFCKLLAFEVDRAEGYLQAGWPLVDCVSRGLRVDVELFVRGGLAVLAAIRRRRYDVWSRRPVVGKLTKLWLLLAAGRSRLLRSETLECDDSSSPSFPSLTDCHVNTREGSEGSKSGDESPHSKDFSQARSENG